jgi:hypothetical protein
MAWSEKAGGAAMQRASRPSADEARGHFRRIPSGRAAFLRCVRCSTLDDALHRFRAERLHCGENRSRRGRQGFFSSLLGRELEPPCPPPRNKSCRSWPVNAEASHRSRPRSKLPADGKTLFSHVADGP